MQSLNIKYLAVILLLLWGVSACDVFEVEKVTDPNNPSSEVVLKGATKGQLQSLVNGLESANRFYLSANNDWWSLVGTFAREMYYLNTSDPTYANEWLQYPSYTKDAGIAKEDHNFFVSGSAYGSPYTAVREANLLILAVQNTDAVTEAEANGYIGFAKTIKAYQLMIPLMFQYENGIRVALPYTKPLEPGPFLSYDEALAEIRKILDEGATALQNAGSSFSFTLSSGFEGFSTPAGMLKVNRAIAARAAIYAEDWQGALNALDKSFLKLTTGADAMFAGPAHVYTGGLDLTNPYFFVPNAPDNVLVVVHPDVIADAEPGDLRIQRKFDKRTTPATPTNIPDDDTDLPALELYYQDGRYASTTSPIPFIRNEELILIYAEAKAQTGQLQDAVNAINLIRSTWGLDDFSSASKSEVIDQILHERRYSLWGEGHRWIDMRRYGRLDEIDTSYDGGRVPMQVGRPQGEIDWECYENPDLEQCS